MDKKNDLPRSRVSLFFVINVFWEKKYLHNNIGKNIGDDFKEGKVTLPLLLALRQSNVSEKLFWKKVIEDLDQENNDFKHAQSLLTKYNCIVETKNIAKFKTDTTNELNVDLVYLYKIY